MFLMFYFLSSLLFLVLSQISVLNRSDTSGYCNSIELPKVDGIEPAFPNHA